MVSLRFRFIVLQAFIFTPTNDTFPHEGAAPAGDYCALMLAAPTVVVNYHPVMGHAHFVGLYRQRTELLLGELKVFLRLKWLLGPGDFDGLPGLGRV